MKQISTKVTNFPKKVLTMYPRSCIICIGWAMPFPTTRQNPRKRTTRSYRAYGSRGLRQPATATQSPRQFSGRRQTGRRPHGKAAGGQAAKEAASAQTRSAKAAAKRTQSKEADAIQGNRAHAKNRPSVRAAVRGGKAALWGGCHPATGTAAFAVRPRSK